MLDVQQDAISFYIELIAKDCDDYGPFSKPGPSNVRQFSRIIYGKHNVFVLRYRTRDINIDNARRTEWMRAMLGAFVRMQLKPGPDPEFSAEPSEPFVKPPSTMP